MASGAIGLPRDTAAWVGSSTGGRVVAARRLTGGVASSVHRCTVVSPGGARTSVVLRRWTGVDPMRAMEVVERELGVLRQLEATSIPAPVPLAVSDSRGGDRTAALLMTRVPGRMDLAPRDTRSWLRQIAAALVAVHSLPLDLPVDEPAARPSPDDVPPWAERPALWREALSVVQSPQPDGSRCFSHGDFQHFNLLWSRQRLSGIVDWTHPGTGAPDRDVAHCRLNLTVLYGHEMAEELRLAYEAEAGRRVDPWWDLHRLTGYGPDWQRFIPIQVRGRVPVDVAGMTRRVEEAMAGALLRL